jgi:hypothetical protein
VNSKESFIIELIKRANPKAFVKCISDRPSTLSKFGLNGLQSLMVSLHVDKLVLLPRISKVVRKTLDQVELHVFEIPLSMTDNVKEMHQLLIEIM